MSEIRGEKVVFGKNDIVALHSLPSAQAHDPCIVDAPPPRRSFGRRCAKFLSVVMTLSVLIIAGLLVTMESGVFDRMLNERATAALNSGLGDGFHAEVGGTVMRLSGSGALALNARDVTLVKDGSNARILTTRSVLIELNPLALLRGRVAVSRIEAEGATIDPALFPSGGPLDLTRIRIAAVSEGLETVFKQMDGLAKLIARSDTDLVRVADLTLSLSGPRGRIIPFVVNSLDFTRQPDGAMQIDGDFRIDGHPSQLRLRAERDQERVVRLTGMVGGMPLSALLRRAETANEPAFGLTSSAALNIVAQRATDTGQPTLSMTVSSTEGLFDAGGMSSSLKPSSIDVSYDFEQNAVSILPSVVHVGRSSFPLTGKIADLDPASGKQGFSIDLLLQSAVSAPEDVTEPPLVFDAKAHGRFLSETHELLFDELRVSSGLGSLAGSLAMKFGETSPQISFAALTTDIQTAAVKQLWPWWVGRNARKWVVANIFGGTVTNGRIEAFLPQGRLTEANGPLVLADNELNIGFNIGGARINVAGDIPPLRDAAGSLTIKGEKTDVRVDGGTAYFPSGRSVNLTGGTFMIPNNSDKPLMAEMRMSVTGEADAIAELISYRPILALQKTPFKPEDFSGPVTAEVGARFGLVMAQQPPPPQWQTEMVLDGVTLNTPIAGRSLSQVTGTLRVDKQKAVLDAKANIDGAPMTLAVIEPVGKDSPIKRQRMISGTVSPSVLAKFAPGLSGIVDGPLPLELNANAADHQTVSVDLGEARLSLPWLGWSKGPGIPAKASFELDQADGLTKVGNLVLTGDGFGAKGDLQLDSSGLSTAKFSSVSLSRNDSYAISIKRQKGGFGVTVNGETADIRPVIESLRAAGSGSSANGGGNPPRIAINASLDSVSGFHGERLSNMKLDYAARGRNIDALKLSAATGSGQAVVANMVKAGADNTLELTTGDAGALARFADVYANMRGGLLNLKLRDRGAGSWRGTLDLRKFSIIDEARLQSMVSTPADAQGRSLNQAVRKNIDVSSQRFERGFANVALDDGIVAIGDGLVRGTDVGATFQGTVRDSNGRMDMTGTFMPAYGLNRLFGEVPIIGALLGNGRDRGLLGITFKLSGPFNKPDLQINPLSIIAPGVFRNIFEFQ